MTKLKVSVVGIGNAGNQVAALAASASGGGFPAVALNSSASDLETVNTKVSSIILGDQRGAGKDRNIAKQYIAKGVKQILDTDAVKAVTEGIDICVIVSSTGGGTGSGAAPIIENVFSQYFPDTHFIILGILPTIGESLATQHNSYDYLQDMLKSEPTYMLYDNECFDATSPVMRLRGVNESIIEDLKVIRGDYQKTTEYGSIDEQDSMKIYRTPGRLVLGHASDDKANDTVTQYFEEGKIEEVLVNAVTSSTHAEIELDNVVARRGVIFNLSEKLYNKIDFDLPVLQNEFGEPIEGFDHSKLNPKESDINSVALILSGLSFPNDRLEKIKERINKATELIESAQKPTSLDLDTGSVESLREQEVSKKPAMDLEDILNLY